MKRYLTLLLLTGICVSLTAQNDLRIFNIGPRPYTELKTGKVYQIACSVMAITDVVPSERITIAYTVNGGPETIGIPKTVIYWLRKGEVESYTFKLTVPDLEQDTLELKVYFKMASDTNASNDTMAANYLVRKRVENDLKISQLSTQTAVKAADTLAFNAVVHNVGSNTLKSGTHLITGITLNDWFREQSVVTTYEANDLEPGDSAIISFDYAIPRQFAGTRKKICYEAYWARSASLFSSIESITDDNKACVQLKVGWPNNVDDISDKGIEQIHMADGHLKVVMKEGVKIKRLEVFALSGERVFVSNGHENQYAVGHLPEGIYLVKVRDEMGRFYSGKVSH